MHHLSVSCMINCNMFASTTKQRSIDRCDATVALSITVATKCSAARFIQNKLSCAVCRMLMKILNFTATKWWGHLPVLRKNVLSCSKQ